MSETPTPNPLAAPDAWNLVAAGYVEENVRLFEHFSRDALALAGVGPGMRVLDVATGPGTLALLAAQTASSVAAIDFSTEMVAHLEARRRAAGAGNVEVRTGDGQALPYGERSFDAAFSMFGLMFFPDRARGFAELKRVLVPGGRAVVSAWQPIERAPVLAAVSEVLARAMPGPSAMQGRVLAPLSDPEVFRAELEGAGFADVRIEASIHADEAPSLDELWRSLQRAFAPLVLMRARMGEERYAQVAQAVRRGLEERLGSGPIRVEMPAWLGVGTA